MHASATACECVLDVFEFVFEPSVTVSKSVFKDFEGALKGVRCGVEFAKSVIYSDTHVKSQYFDLYALATAFECV